MKKTFRLSLVFLLLLTTSVFATDFTTDNQVWTSLQEHSTTNAVRYGGVTEATGVVNGAFEFDGDLTTTAEQYEAIKIISDGANWLVI